MTPEETNLTLLVGRMDGKLDMLLARTEGFDTRLRATERSVWWGKGAAALCAALFIPKFRALTGI